MQKFQTHRLNKLFNDIFKTSDVNYISGKVAIDNCYKKLAESQKEDKILSKIFLYFFPDPNYTTEKNEETFWFEKYKDDKIFDEYDFAEELLNCYFEYSKDKNTNDFNAKIGEVYLKFGDYKLFQFYYFVIKRYKDNLISTIAYFTKLSSYYETEFKTYIYPDNIQTVGFIINLRELLIKEEQISKLANKIDNLEKKLDEVSLENKKMHKTIELGEHDIKKLEIKIGDLSEKITKLDENDKIKTIQLENLHLDKGKVDTQIQSLTFQLKIMQEDKIQLGNQLQDLQNNKDNYELQIQDIKNENENLKNDIAELKYRMDKKDLRDTLNYSFKYMYEVLRSQSKEIKEKEMKEENNH